MTLDPNNSLNFERQQAAIETSERLEQQRERFAEYVPFTDPPPEPIADSGGKWDIHRLAHWWTRWLDAHRNIKPVIVDVNVFGACTVQVQDRESLAAFVRACGDTKIERSSNIYIKRQFGQLTVMCYGQRELVCRKVVKQVVKPAMPEQIIPAMPERIEEEVVWDCGDPILAPTPTA